MKLTGVLLSVCYFETPGWSRTHGRPQAYFALLSAGVRCELSCLAYYFQSMVLPELLEPRRTNPQLAAICIRTPGVMPTGVRVVPESSAAGCL